MQGKWKLTPAWLSRDIDMAEEAIIANGIVFAYGAGEDSTQTVQDTRVERADSGPHGRRPLQRCETPHSRARAAPSWWRSTD